MVFGQGKTISGKVVDSAGEPLPGVSISIEGTTQGTVTDINGNFNLADVPETATLNFSFIGFENLNISVEGQSVFNVTMKESSIGLDEVVAVGYGTRKRSDITGAVASVNADELNAIPVSNVVQGMQGKLAGVDITTNSRPGEIGIIRIRGERSITATSDPLYVVDGIPLAAGGIEALNPQDIETVDVLKDASATAIYGSRGANGVVLITTKKGESGKATVTYNGYINNESQNHLKIKKFFSIMFKIIIFKSSR